VDAAAREEGGARILMFPMAGQDGDTSDPEGAVARRQIRRLLETAIDGLPGRFRLVLVARDVDGMSVEETADVLGLRPETVRTRLHRARRLLRAAAPRPPAAARRAGGAARRSAAGRLPLRRGALHAADRGGAGPA
jgi:DNA-directed RNA polymerase specialized sigma24 family protein